MKQSEKTENTKARILASAEREFSDKGIFGARIDEIAELAGVNKRMIYEHFGNKDELYRVVLQGVYARLAEYERRYYIEDMSPDAAIRNIVHVSFSFLEKNPTFVRLLMWENLGGTKFLENDEVSKIKTPTIEYIRSQIQRGKKTGIFAEHIDEEQMVISLLNFEFSYFSNMHTLSGILKTDLSDAVEISKRAAFVSDLFIKYLTNRA